MENLSQITTATKISTVIVTITAVIVFGVAMFLIFQSPIHSSSDDSAGVETAGQTGN